jgi:Ca-activated chloride channel homolog
MRFENPAWLALLALLPLLTIIFVAGERRAARNLKRFASARLLPALDQSARWPRIVRHILTLLAVAFIACALARPSYGYRLREIHGKGADVIFAVDVSRSMLCADVTPDRLTRAKMAASDMLEAAKGHRVGVIPFAGLAFVQCPLTLDDNAVRLSLSALDATTSIPRAGTSLAEPIAEARKAFGEGDGRKILVIFTDGEDLEGEGLREARATKGVTIITVGIGTASGAPVPLSAEAGSGYTHDGYGSLVTSRLDASGLRSLAAATGGYYDPVGSISLASHLKDVLDKDAGAENAQAASMRLPIIRYRWPLSIALILIAAESLLPAFRRKSGAVMLAFFILLPLAPSHSEAADLAQQTAPDAAEAQPAQPVKPVVPPGNPRESYNEGVKLYKQGDYEKAAAAFEKALAQDAGKQPELEHLAHGNAGTTRLAQAQRLIPSGADVEIPQEDADKAREYLKQARAHLEKAMSLAPDDKLLRKNFDKVGSAVEEIGKHKARAKTEAEKKKEKEEKQKKENKKDPDMPPINQPPEKPKDKPKDDDKDNKGGQQGGQGGGGGASSSQSSSGEQQDKQQQQQQGQSGQSSQDSQPQQGQSDQQQQQQSQPQQDKQSSQPQSQQQQNQQQQGQSGQQQQSQQDKQPSQMQSQQQQNQQQQQPNQPQQGQSQQSQSPQDKPSPQAQTKPENADKKQGAGSQEKNELKSPQDKQPQALPKPGEEKAAAAKAAADEKRKAEDAKAQGQQPKPQPQGQQQQNQPGQSQQDKQTQQQKAAAQAPQPTPQPEKSAADAASAPQPQPKQEKPEDKKAAAGASEEKKDGKDAAAKAGKQGPKPDDKGKDEAAAAAAEKSDKKDAAQQAAAAAEEKPASQEKPRSEGDHTQGLERPGEPTAQAQTVAGDQPAESDAKATATVNADVPGGNKIAGEMTPDEAEQLLRILKKGEKILPAGELTQPQGNNSAGKDW